jgi:hypothetical protein
MLAGGEKDDDIQTLVEADNCASRLRGNKADARKSKMLEKMLRYLQPVSDLLPEFQPPPKMFTNLPRVHFE